MGVAPPLEFGPDAVDDPSELRRLALWTLEGKSSSDNALIGSFTKVEIPELNTLDINASSDVTQGDFTLGTVFSVLPNLVCSTKVKTHTLTVWYEWRSCRKARLFRQASHFILQFSQRSASYSHGGGGRGGGRERRN